MNNQTYFHTLAFFGSVTNGVANMAIAMVNDQIVTPNSSNQALMPMQGQLRAGVASSANLQRMRINTPSLRNIGLPYIAPINNALTVQSPPNIWDPGRLGPVIPKSDAISLEGTQGGGAAENAVAALWLSFGRQEIPQGPEYRIRFTATVTCVAGSWVNGAITFDTTLPAGVYAVTGFDAQGTNLYFARLVFAGGSWRPGCLARNTLASVQAPLFTRGDLGTYGTFDSVNTPTVDFLSTGACTAQEGYMDVVRIGDR